MANWQNTNEENQNKDDSTIDIDSLLDIFSNTTRRKILQLLSSEALYPFQIARILDISPRLISKYIKELEGAGLVSTDERDSDKGPTRRYAKLNKSFSLIIDVSPNNFGLKVVPIFEIEDDTPKEDQNRDETQKKQELLKNISELCDKLRHQLSKIGEIEEERRLLFKDINSNYSVLNDIIENEIYNYSDRVIIRNFLKMLISQKQKEVSLTDLSASLRVWKGDLLAHMTRMSEETGLLKVREDQSGEIFFSI